MTKRSFHECDHDAKRLCVTAVAGRNANSDKNSIMELTCPPVTWQAQSEQRNNVARQLFESMKSYFRQEEHQCDEMPDIECQNCGRLDTRHSTSKCRFCEKTICGECCQRCNGCSQDFCTFCSVRNYDNRDMLAFCFSCKR